MLQSINELQQKVDEMLLKVGLPMLSINLCSAPIGDGTPYISFENHEYNYIISERGYEFSRKVTKSEDELLYWIMSELAYKIAFQYELEHRIEDRDGRRIVFPKFIEIMQKINPKWKLKAEAEIKKTLAITPYDDKPYYVL
ncbi:Imm63 family immunity protein [Rosenbergiella epipactidis]|uniref:Imm63 family immunity protein n=1 Tax=Rosenbergiella epipactidis TaxID=1544694 RepID=UPI001F4DAFEB|nr:Imm63 family immunity protein [Rosenbergiella epipactidis]